MARPNVLILGQAEEPFEQQTMELLATNQRSECTIESKDDRNLRNLMDEAEKSDFIIMCYRDDPEDEKEVDSKLLKDLRPHENHLMLIAENRDELMDTLDDMRIHAFRLFKSSTSNKWQKQLLEEVIDWKGKNEGPERGPFHKQILNYLTRTDNVLKKVASIAAGAATILATIVAYQAFLGAEAANENDSGPATQIEAEQ